MYYVSVHRNTIYILLNSIIENVAKMRSSLLSLWGQNEMNINEHKILLQNAHKYAETY